MRHKGIDKDETRRKVTDAASRGFRKYGYAGIGVNALADGAGVTSGAFYAHFGSKSGAFDVALTTGLDEVIAGVAKFQQEFGADWVKAFVDYYLGKAHREDLECGCAMASLTSEVVRSEAGIRVTFEKKMHAIAGLVAGGLEGTDAEATRARAWAMLGILIGGLNIARAMSNNEAVREVVDAIKTAAVKAAGPTRVVMGVVEQPTP